MASFITVFLLSLLTTSVTYSEELSFNDSPLTIQCTNASTTCIINCIGINSCNETEIHCHLTASQACIINLFADQSGQKATINTHNSPLIFINGTGADCGEHLTIYAHERMSSKLYINGAIGPDISKWDFRYATIFSPVGQGSLLSMKCNCRNVIIYDDWTTEIYQQPIGHLAFRSLTVENIFDTTNAAGISRSHNNYVGLNTAYRAPVFLNSDDCLYPDRASVTAPRPWQRMNWNGHNHGNWLIYAYAYDSFVETVINATADIAPYGQVTEYDIILLGVGADTNLYDLTLFADQFNQNGPNIYAEANEWQGLTKTKIYAKHANSVTIYCHSGGDCHYIMVECPENNQNNSCKIYCDSTVDPGWNDSLVEIDPDWNGKPSSAARATTECYDMKIYTTNGYCKDAAVICTGNTCVFDTNSSNEVKVYCGYQQNTDYCTLNNNGDLTNFGAGNCNNGYNSETECDAIIQDPISKISTFTHQCDVFPLDITVLIESLTDIPTNNPTYLPTTNPTYIPTHNPTYLPTINPTYIPTNIPSHIPTVNPTSNPTSQSGSPTSTPTNHPSVNPTNDPLTNSPTFKPTQKPSASPTNIDDRQITEYLTTQFAVGTVGNINVGTWFEGYLLFVIIGGSVLLCLALVCVFCYICLHKRKNIEKNVKNMELVRITSDTETVNSKVTKKDSVVPANNALKMWLNNLGLSEYYSSFVEQGFDSKISMLYQLKDENLKEIGIKKMADRLLIIRALNTHKMNNNSETESEHLYDVHDGPGNNIVTAGNDVVDTYGNGQMIKNVNNEEEWEYFEDGEKKDNNSGSDNMYNNSDSEKMYNTTANVTSGCVTSKKSPGLD